MEALRVVTQRAEAAERRAQDLEQRSEATARAQNDQLSALQGALEQLQVAGDTASAAAQGGPSRFCIGA